MQIHSLSNVYTAIVVVALFLKRKNIRSERMRGARVGVQTEMLEFIALPFPFLSKLKFWLFHVVVVQ